MVQEDRLPTKYSPEDEKATLLALLFEYNIGINPAKREVYVLGGSFHVEYSSEEGLRQAITECVILSNRDHL